VHADFDHSFVFFCFDLAPQHISRSLTSLQNFYGDNRKHRGRAFDSEAEFAAYTLLMKLEENVPKLCLALPPDVLRSSHVQFALQVYSAMVESNPARFFSLVKRASIIQV
jgi:hypothetical protein